MTTAEQLFYTTVYITAHGSNGEVSTGTGFLVDYPSPDGGSYTTLVTNKHVLEGFDRVDFSMIGARNGRPTNLRVTTPVEGMDAKPWHGHPDPSVDVAVMPFATIANSMAAQGLAPYFVQIPSSMLLTKSQAEELDAIEEVKFVGYPNGIFDTENFLPIMRSGATATPLQIDYRGQPAFLIDAAVFPGSSGSPVFIYDRNGYRDRAGTVHVGGARLHLLGIVAAMHVRQSSWQVVDVPTATMAVGSEVLGLGIVFKASAIQECAEMMFAAEGIEIAPPTDELA